MKKIETKKLHQYTIRIPCDLYKKVKIKLVNEDKKLSPVLIEMLTKYIKS